jgi:heterodisulfide reductase subunit A-like polyferredoxin
MQSQKAGSNMLASSGYLAVVDKDNCIGCGICEQACQFEAITMQDGISQISYAICMGCGICVNQCSQTAISLNRDTAKGIPLELDQLLEEYQAGSVH